VIDGKLRQFQFPFRPSSLGDPFFEPGVRFGQFGGPLLNQPLNLLRLADQRPQIPRQQSRDQQTAGEYAIWSPRLLAGQVRRRRRADKQPALAGRVQLEDGMRLVSYGQDLRVNRPGQGRTRNRIVKTLRVSGRGFPHQVRMNLMPAKVT